MTKAISILLMLVLGLSHNLRAETITICTSCKINSISQGVAIAADFDTLFIKKGTYKEFNIQIAKPLTLIGEAGAILDGEDKGEIITILAVSK